MKTNALPLIFIEKGNPQTVMKNIQKNYEWVGLPSKGLCYPVNSPLRRGKVKVAYLTAKDENIFFSEKHIKEGLICDTLLKTKVKDEDIDTSLLCSGDKEAIVLWLLKTGYGDSYQIAYTNETIDLNKIGYKDFNLLSDDNGNFNYYLLNRKKVTFHYLPYRKEETLIKDCIETMKTVEETDASYIDVYKKITIPILLGMIVSVEGVKDIEKWLSELDFDTLRKMQRYITNNAAGLDMKTTKGLIFDDTVFYNINIKNESLLWA